MPRRVQHCTDQIRPDHGKPVSSLTLMRTDTVFVKLPIHQLAKAGAIHIEISKTNAQGILDLYWQVSPSTVHGAPQLLAYKLDTLVINRHLDALGRPLPTLIRLGSMRTICQELGLGTGKSTADVKNALHQNAGAYITAKLHYRGRDGKQRRLEAGFNRYGVVLTGESLPDSTTADAVYIVLNESYRQVLNAAPTRPVDYDYLSGLKPLAQRFYELLSFRMFAALKHHHAEVTMRYSEFCLYAPLQRYGDGSKMSKQMHKVHLPHLASGYLAGVSTERVVDEAGDADWLIHYIPGPKARAEYHAFTGRHRQDRLSLQVMPEPDARAAAPGDASDAVSVERVQAAVRTQQSTMDEGHGGQDMQVVARAPQPEAIVEGTPGCAPREVAPMAHQASSARALVQQFYRDVHGISDRTPHPKELTHASDLLLRHSPEFAAFFLTFALRAVRQEGRTVHVFGGLMRYETSAVAAYRQQEAQAAAQQAEATAQHQRQQCAAYETWLRQRLDALKAARPPEQLEALRDQVRQRVRRGERLPSYLLARHVEHEIESQLIQAHALPSFEAWCQQHESQTVTLWTSDAKKE